uniref:Uncharacterized protein n=1 Tax=Eucampia antarctica TaxID=49252 RepID=A0A7S2R5B5_9STRA|mmetsp:Transcript_17068/g.16495  ORF Transcript_17068/g.16495 Transcript_17068/m.16495 type:complete len:203 (+) Transcript_17068:102-710(+)|eukprot:CAMPEP_0197828072 /NCGR_PEP_ID=MMETSP1437-20131217/4716_1 /TAXON_ID=49252 ORGANISM="Eucampia antarctica, Strain CCMP1452" /NCGR_SAMPLE_ID=MMETSP1437 /ASSEMBLY_ACC=CAM_ASM_001096 /LENGTH=202 /DNA_ID=CAMNT_0043429161 /DNA_START=102 /DNA_END=710 /DNA_ORIENTATION=-
MSSAIISSTYNQTEIQHANAEEQNLMGLYPAEAKKQSYYHRITIGCIVTLSCVLLLVTYNSIAAHDEGAAIPIEGAKGPARNCNFDECFDSSCNADVAPYMCMRHNGGPHGGCSPIEWTSFTCDDQCSMKKCAEMEIPEDTNNCAGVECGADWCKNGQLCNTDVSYQCQNGSARYGCSADPLQWTLFTHDSTCSDCCDTTTC